MKSEREYGIDSDGDIIEMPRQPYPTYIIDRTPQDDERLAGYYYIAYMGKNKMVIRTYCLTTHAEKDGLIKIMGMMTAEEVQRKFKCIEGGGSRLYVYEIVYIEDSEAITTKAIQKRLEVAYTTFCHQINVIRNRRSNNM